jgi:mannose-6-phosphate isomerase-like protein (cupin superfamily)
VVTGVSESGQATFVSDGPIELLAAHLLPPGIEEVWGFDGQPNTSTATAVSAPERYFPPAAGFRVRVISFRPDGQTKLTPAQAAEVGELLVGLHGDAEWDDATPGMHATRTIDVGVILEGSVELELDSGEVTTLAVGDWYVQNGTRHRWRNASGSNCRVAIFMVGAQAA